MKVRSLLVFNQVSLDGFICDAQGDMQWAHKQDPEWHEFVANNASGDAELLFGRVTYQQMERFWPTKMAEDSMPIVAKRMNAVAKVVFSRSLAQAHWQNTRLIKTDLAEAVSKLKTEAGPPMVLMGSGSIVAQLAQHGLIDSFQVVVNPIVLGTGKSMFAGVKEQFGLKLTNTRRFENGNVVLYYELAR